MMFPGLRMPIIIWINYMLQSRLRKEFEIGKEEVLLTQTKNLQRRSAFSWTAAMMKS